MQYKQIEEYRECNYYSEKPSNVTRFLAGLRVVKYYLSRLRFIKAVDVPSSNNYI